MEISEKIIDLARFANNGIMNFVDFISGIPSFIYNLIEVIPRPLYDILIAFIPTIIFVIILYALGKVISCVK